MIVRISSGENQRQPRKVAELSLRGRKPAQFRHHHIHRDIRLVLLAKAKRFFPVSGAQYAIPQTRQCLPRHFSDRIFAVKQNEEKFLPLISVL